MEMEHTKVNVQNATKLYLKITKKVQIVNVKIVTHL